MIRSGELKDWAEAARLIGITRARMTQIANLMLLAPEIQEAVLDSALFRDGDDQIREFQVRPFHNLMDWQTQRHEWAHFFHEPNSSSPRSRSSSQQTTLSSLHRSRNHSLESVRLASVSLTKPE